MYWPWPEWAGAGVFTLLEGHVARAVHVSRSNHVPEQAAKRLGHKHAKITIKMHTDKENVPKRHIILHCMLVVSRSGPELVLR